MVEYVGFTFAAESLATAILLLSSISIVLIVIAQRTLIRNSARWKVLQGMIPKDEIWSTSTSGENLQIAAHIRHGLKIQRGLTVIVLGILLVSMIAGVSLYTTYVGNSTLFIHHVSPNDEERLSVGGWNVYDIDVQPPFPGLFNRLSIYCSIENWGNASDSLSFYFDIIAMNSTEFNSLDEESRFELLSSHRLNHTWDGRWGFGLDENLEESYGSYIYVLRIIADANPLENSYVEASLFIFQEGS
jgi:hypothetical protein